MISLAVLLAGCQCQAGRVCFQYNEADSSSSLDTADILFAPTLCCRYLCATDRSSAKGGYEIEAIVFLDLAFEVDERSTQRMSTSSVAIAILHASTIPLP